MVETDTDQPIIRTENEDEVKTDSTDTTEKPSDPVEVSPEEEAFAKRKKEAKKGLSITRALITFGYESWVAFEPGG